MFRGDHRGLSRALGHATMLARRFGHPRVGSEHLLLALATMDGPLATVLHRGGATAAALGEAVRQAAPLGAGVAADRDILAPLGIDMTQLAMVADRPPPREPLLPLRSAAARRRCAQLNPPLGLDAQATYEASLRLALARRERDHQPHHLALALVALDPGVTWVLQQAGVDAAALLADLAAAFAPPYRNPLLRAERRIGRAARCRDIVRRYRHTSGRVPSNGLAIPALISGGQP